MFLRFVAEEVVDSVILHKPGHEIEIGLAVLDAVDPLRIGLGQAQLVIAKAQTLVWSPDYLSICGIACFARALTPPRGKSISNVGIR